MLKLENENVTHSESNILIFLTKITVKYFLIKEDMLYILLQMQRKSSQNVKSVVIQAFQEDVQKKYALPPKNALQELVYIQC